MIKICMQGEWLLLDEYQNYFIEVDEEGNQSMQFEIPLSVLYGGYTVETQVEDAYGRWLIKKINQLNKRAVISMIGKPVFIWTHRKILIYSQKQ